jgi:uncharacterized protein
MARQIKVFLLKVAGRCNIACDYCYEYRSADTSWRSNPQAMSGSVLDASIGRISEHVVGHSLRRVTVIFHGGEPLLAGRTFLEHAVGKLRCALPEGVDISFGLQTNGILLDEEWLDCFLRLNIPSRHQCRW